MLNFKLKLFILPVAFGAFWTLQNNHAQADGVSADVSNALTQQKQQAPSEYTDSINHIAEKAKSVVSSGIKEFNEQTLPHEAKDLRKQIVRLRDILDVFPHNFAHELELWDEVRDGLDDGYTVVGDFKDLFDANPEAVEGLQAGRTPEYKDQKKLKERRKKVLEWKKTFFAEGGLAEMIGTLFLDVKPLSSENTVNSSKYSDFFWGGVRVTPSALNSPAQNARLLVNAQAQISVEENPVVLKIKDPTTEENELVFHDHRKRLRTMTKVCNVANALSEGTCNPDAVKSIEALVVELGEIEDLIITGRHFEEDGKNKKADDAYEDARKKFKKLKKNFKDKDMLEPLKSL